MPDRLAELRQHLSDIYDLRAVAYLMEWDQSTYMPRGGAPARARQTALLEGLVHERLTDPKLGRLLEDLRSYEERLSYDSDDASLIRVARRDHERAVRVPTSFMSEAYGHFAQTYQVWMEARPANDFQAVRPYLEKSLDLSRRYAEFFPESEHIADPLIAEYDHGMTASAVSKVFADLRAQLVPLVEAVTSQAPADDSCLRLQYPEAPQWEFGLDVVRRLGYDLARGRQDKSPHPFTTMFSIGDVRITIRVRERDLGEALFGSIHEAGHAMYEQGVDRGLEGTPLAEGTSAGVHESQSRLWENVVGRSRSFWSFYYPRLQAVFPEQLGEVSLDTFYRAVNKVQRSLIRTEADELTYNLHVMLRFDLELEMLEGKLAVRDLPEAWRERFRTDLGIVPSDDRDGVLQDVHWYWGFIGGAFQGYTLGNILSALFFEAALQEHPGIPDEMEQGEFGTLLGWLQQKIYRHGRKLTADELAQRITGGPMRIEPYMSYLRNKYGALYEV
ncbi:MAG: carboxypeptidase M32 [Anaerolineae bacterium]|nr:carboxypeptidase M32 [Anaerolineae bacterium]